MLAARASLGICCQCPRDGYSVSRIDITVILGVMDTDPHARPASRSILTVSMSRASLRPT
jgi:hypothetical protein